MISSPINPHFGKATIRTITPPDPEGRETGMQPEVRRIQSLTWPLSATGPLDELVKALPDTVTLTLIGKGATYIDTDGQSQVASTDLIRRTIASANPQEKPVLDALSSHPSYEEPRKGTLNSKSIVTLWGNVLASVWEKLLAEATKTSRA